MYIIYSNVYILYAYVLQVLVKLHSLRTCRNGRITYVYVYYICRNGYNYVLVGILPDLTDNTQSHWRKIDLQILTFGHARENV